MISAFANTWKVAELRERILYTLVMIVIVRLGVFITMPGIDATVIDKYVADQQGKDVSGGMLGMMATMLSGGGLS